MEHQNNLSANTANTHRLRRLVRWLTPNGGSILLFVLAVALMVTQNAWAGPAAAPLNVPGPSATTVNYQGRLANSGGTPINGTQTMQFAIYNAASGGSVIWGPETHTNVPVTAGLFSVGLGSQTSGGIPTTVWDGDRYLQIIVGGETLTPREPIRSVPIAGLALTVPDGAVTSAKIADGTIATTDLANNAVTAAKQTITTYYGSHNSEVMLNGTATVLLSQFQFTNVPAGNVSIISTLNAIVTTGKSPRGSVRLSASGYELDALPTHIFADYNQMTLMGQIQNFPGGTLTIQIQAIGEITDTSVKFGVTNDSRFGRRVMVIAGQ
jgi:hypothetical protein